MSDNHSVQTDGVSVWVNSNDGYCLARFSKMGIDIHQKRDSKDGLEGECFVSTFQKVTSEDWEAFKKEVLRHHCITITDEHKPKRFR